MSEPLKILHVLDHSVPLQSGYSFRTRAIIEQQHAMGWDTVQLTSPKHYGTTAAEEIVDGLKFYRTPVPKGWRDLPVITQLAVIEDTARRVAQLVDRERPDIIHAHSPCLNGLAALRVARRGGLPLLYELRALWEDAAVDHGTTRAGSLRYKGSRALETWVLKRSDAITTICEGLRAEIIARGLPSDKVTVIPNAVDVAAFPFAAPENPQLRARLGLTGSNVIGFFGSFYAYEGLGLLLEALPVIVREIPDVTLLLAGGGPEEARLRELVTASGMAGRVHFVGRIPHAEIASYYALASVLVYPRLSTRLTETVTPLKPLEAMALGRLVVASNVGGHRELIRDGATGFLFEPGNAAALAHTAVSALRLAPHSLPMRQRAREFVATQRTWEASVARYESVYRSLRGLKNRADGTA